MPYVPPLNLTTLWQLQAHGTWLPFFTVVALIRDVDGAPLWLILIGTAVTAVGLAEFIDSMTVLSRLKRGKYRRS